MHGLEHYLDMSIWRALDVVFLGFVGGVLSGFLGTGGAFVMTPGMMNLGIPGVIAVGSNLAHKFGKSLMGARQHASLGHVDRKLGVFLLTPALIGVRIATWLNTYLFKINQDASGKSAGAVGDLYISALFVVVLSIISVAMLVDVRRFDGRRLRRGRQETLSEWFAKFHLRPMVHFPVADVTLSVWVVAVVGLMTGYLAGSIGVGGFLGVPAMIYICGVPTVVAAGTEVFLAIFMGAFGALSYAWDGYVDLRYVFLLYLGSLTGLYIGAYGTKVVKEKLIRLTTALVILVSVFSRLAVIPIYLDRLAVFTLPGWSLSTLSVVSKVILFGGGTGGVLFILVHVLRAYRRRRRVHQLLNQRH
jgi:uncharacterized membrane protein YfcA